MQIVFEFALLICCIFFHTHEGERAQTEVGKKLEYGFEIMYYVINILHLKR